MPTSAGLLMYARTPQLQILLAHPGGPFFVGKDDGVWSIPKGLIQTAEEPLAAAQREFVEETGYQLPAELDYLPLGHVQLRGGKTVYAWAFEGCWERDRVPSSNTFAIEWPPKSGRTQRFPEIDRAEMFSVHVARHKIHPQQQPFIDRLLARLPSQGYENA